ncbi:MAG: LamG domain-containing protein [Colwellia sp.]|nr:LamG domain-containing protein [Colwellia sp.]
MSYEINKYGFDFDGASYLTLDNSLQDLTDNDFTLMWWQEPIIKSGWHTILATQDNDTQRGFSIRVISDGIVGRLLFTEYYNGDDARVDTVSTSILLTGKNHINFVFDSSNISNSKFYINGDVEVSTYNAPTNTKQKSNVTYIGKLKSVGIEDFCDGIFHDIKIFDSVLTQAQIQSEMTENNITTIGHWTLDQTLDDSSPNNNDATVTGVDQYAIISTETIYGTKCTKTETFEQDASITFDELIYAWFYGGTIKIEVDNLAWKTIKILAYDDESNSYLPIKVETTTLREHTIVIPKTATRRLKLSIDSDSTFTKVVYTLESIFDVINDTDSNSSGAVAIDYNVIYSDVNIEKRSMSFRVNDSDAHFAQSILQNKVYLDNEIYQVTSLQVSELDVNRKEFKCDFLRLLNE